VVLRVPKVKAEDRIDLITPLTTMGLTTPWGSEAEFEDLVSLDENQFFMVSDFFQKSTAEWDEHESKGAAVTVGIGRVRTTSLPAPEPVKYFIIDRPFLAILVDDATGLFIGSFAIEAPVQ
jgi:serine protease inhibitor